MARYSPTVRREEYSPLAAALDQGLEGGIRGARLREERERNQEGRYDRQRGREWEDETRGRERTIWEREDFEFEDEIRQDPRYSTEPPERPAPGPHSELPEAGIRYGQDRTSVLPEVLPGEGRGGPSGPVPGQFIPGQGFAMPGAGGGGAPQLPVDQVREFNDPSPVASVGETDIYSTGVTRDDVLAQELQRELDAMRQRGSVEAEVAGETEAARRQARNANPTPSERASMGNLELRREMDRRRQEAEGRQEVSSYADFFLQEAGGEVPAQQLSRILQARYPDMDPEMVDQVARDKVAGVGARTEPTEQDTELYDNITKLVPPTTPVQRATAQAIANGATTEEQIRAMAGEAGLNEDQLQEALDYLEQISYAR